MKAKILAQPDQQQAQKQQWNNSQKVGRWGGCFALTGMIGCRRAFNRSRLILLADKNPVIAIVRQTLPQAPIGTLSLRYSIA
ncbi:hypothetical protein [Marinimicrobium sp. ABcell2]|uniref:hypothetical protein n=1 Tax=Marinimicrobium sp. ABcell2 TaxID=3069751 RepID=UPI0027B796E1|nr:hypothetical protein [Marinimicrobium sp. ABcell2]MDQ2077983.1 hypothetical protein [Marinimicrobium sp. ABcell2]